MRDYKEFENEYVDDILTPLKEGIYKATLTDIKIITSNNKNQLLITTFKAENKTFDYILVIPQDDTSGWQFNKLVKWLKSLNTTLDTIKTVIGKDYVVDLKYNANGYTNCKIVEINGL